MAVERLTFESARGLTLSARLDRPDGPQVASALFAHCFTCGKDIAAARRIAARLAAEGFAVVRFDFTGLGHSEGEFENTSFTSNVDDLVAAARHMAEMGMAPDLLVGHSLGGAAALKAAPLIESVKAVATLGAPFDPGHVTHNFAGALERIEAEGAAEVDLGGRPFRIGRDFVRDVLDADLEPTLQRLGRALLVLHAPRDQIVGVENAARIFTAARHPKSFVSLDDADHLVSRPEDAEYAAGLIAAWAARYIDLTPPPPPPAAPEGITRISESDPRGFLQDVTAGGHHLLADEPKSFGGTDQGMTPYNLLCASLGGCTAMTIRMYARRKKIPLSHVRVDVSHEKVHLQDAEAETESKIDSFTRVIALEGDLSEETRATLLSIAERCPVHRTLERGARIVTEAAPS